MKHKGKQYEDRINYLKKLRNTDKARYKMMLKKTEQKFKISRKTIYRDMRKEIPGLRKTRNDSGKMKTVVTTKELGIAQELLEKGTSITNVKKVIKEKTGATVSERKMQKIRSEKKNDDISTTVFADPAREFFEQLFEFKLIPPGRGIELDYGKVKFIVKKQDLRDVILVLSNAYNRSEFAKNNKLDLDRDELRRNMMLHLIEEQMRLAGEQSDYKQVESLTRMLHRMETEFTTEINFIILEKVCKEIKPDISKEDVIRLVKKVNEK